MGSAVALSRYLEQIGKRGYVVRNDTLPANLEYFLMGTSSVTLENFDRSLPLICVDCSDHARIGVQLAETYSQPFLVIDHHKSNKGFAWTSIIMPHAASTTEVLAKLFEKIDVHPSEKIAEALYLGILTDTGRFAYNTSLDTFKYAQLMLQSGVDPNKIYSLVYENDSIQRYRLLERFLANIEFFSENRACISHLSTADLSEVGGRVGDTEGFVDYTRKLAGVVIGCYVEFHGDFVKCSMRSADEHLRLDLLAERFGGGGHACAVGFTADPQTFSLDRLKESIEQHINEFYDGYIAAYR